MNRRSQQAIVVGLLLVTILSDVQGMSTWVAYGLTLVAFLSVAALTVYERPRIGLHKPALLLIAVILLIYAGHLITNPAVTALLSVPTYALSVFVLVFLLPAIVPAADYLYGLSLVAVAMAGLALLLAPFPQFQWQPASDFVVRSVFENPQALGVVVMAGVWGLLPSVRWRDRSLVGGLMALCLLVVVLADNRSMLLGGGGAAAVLVAHRYRGSRASIPVVAVAAVGFVYVLGVVLGAYPGPEPLTTTTLNRRVSLWLAAIEASLQSPLRTVVGYGAVDTNAVMQPFLAGDRPAEGTHNVYFRILLTAGVTGVVAYLGLQAAALDSLRAIDSIEEQAVVGLLITYVVADIFIAASVFGFSTDTFLIASATGYALRIAASNTLDTPWVASPGD